MFGLFKRKKSKDHLKQRLKLVLSYDRAKLSPGKMEQLKHDLLEVIARYFPLHGQDTDVRLEQHGDRTVLIANLPVRQEA